MTGGTGGGIIGDRDLLGYGDNRPDPQWPAGARLAV